MSQITLPKLGFAGRIAKLKTIDSRTGKLCREWSGFDNLIVDGGLDLLGDPSEPSWTTIFLYMQLGTGTTAPTISDSALQAPVGTLQSGSSAVSSLVGGETGICYVSTMRDFTFAAGTIDGVPLAEIGLFSSISGNPMWARTIIKDEMGTPTTIPLLDYEILIVTYEARIYIEETDVSGTFFVGSDEYNYTLRYKRESTAWTGDLTTSNRNPVQHMDRLYAGSNTALTPRLSTAALNDSDRYDAEFTFSAYTPGSFTLVATPPDVPINELNIPGGISMFRFAITTYHTPRYEFLISKVSDGTKLPKDSDHTWTFTDFLQITWGRYVP